MEEETNNMTREKIEMTEKNVIGKCPVCGGDVMESPLGFCCNGTTKEGRRCQFVIHRKMHGVEMTEEICRQLLSEGRTGIMEMKNKKNQPFLAMFIIEDGKVHLDFVSHYMEGSCPICGGRVKKTSKGYACENHVGPNPTCDFYMMGIICNRKITDEEVERFLSGERLTLDGFSTNDGHMFSSTLQLNEKGSVSLESKITKCPVCGGEIHVGMKAYNCSNYKDKDHPCNFSIWRNISGHEVTVEEARQICEDRQTKEVLELYKEDGTIYYKRLGLNKENQVIRI